MSNKKLKEAKYDRLVEIHEITEFDNLLNIIKIDGEDLRENFIFRGLKKSSYELIPSSLREDNKIDEFILKSEFNFNFDEQIKFEFCNDETISFEKQLPKNNITKLPPKYKVRSIEELQFKREIYVLLKFLDYADKIGLKIKASTSVRRWIHNHLSYENKLNDTWPKPEFFEIISLAQHHELPTRALDWSYDFKVALYFAVSAILDDDEKDCILWAFNYKLFEDTYNEEKSKVIIYRPEYNSNPNLKAQKGLFTFIASNHDENIYDKTPFDKVITNYMVELRTLDEELT